MWIAILFLVLLFIAGLMGTTNFPRKKFLAWFQSFYVEFHSSSSGNPSYSAGNYVKIPSADDDQKAIGKTASTCCGDTLQFKSVFATFDKNSDGYITKQELRDSLNSIGMAMSDRDIADVVRRVDSNGDGLIDLDEFCESFDSLLSRGGGMREEEEQMKDRNNEDDDDEDLKEAFDVFDGDKDGVITVEELGMVLSSLGFKEGNKLESCKEMIRKVDMDGDGMVNFHEFKLMMIKAGQRLVPVS